MDSPFKAASASAAEPLGPLTGRTAASRQTTHVVADSREGRGGYRPPLIAKSVPPHGAADLAGEGGISTRPVPVPSRGPAPGARASRTSHRDTMQRGGGAHPDPTGEQDPFSS